jgi:hypothetical protein
MTPTKLLLGQILAVFAIVILGVWFATEWCAAQLDFQARLGAPWFGLVGLQVYFPWRLFEWWYAYDAYAPQLFNEAGGIAASSGIVGCAVAIIGSLWRARQTRLVTTYGSSRWATTREIDAAGLFRPAGVFLGRVGGQYLRHDGPEHVMAFAPTRSGKITATGFAAVAFTVGKSRPEAPIETARMALAFLPTSPVGALVKPVPRRFIPSAKFGEVDASTAAFSARFAPLRWPDALFERTVRPCAFLAASLIVAAPVEPALAALTAAFPAALGRADIVSAGFADLADREARSDPLVERTAIVLSAALHNAL